MTSQPTQEPQSEAPSVYVRSDGKPFRIPRFRPDFIFIDKILQALTAPWARRLYRNLLEAQYIAEWIVDEFLQDQHNTRENQKRAGEFFCHEFMDNLDPHWPDNKPLDLMLATINTQLESLGEAWPSRSPTDYFRRYTTGPAAFFETWANGVPDHPVFEYYNRDLSEAPYFVAFRELPTTGSGENYFAIDRDSAADRGFGPGIVVHPNFIREVSRACYLKADASMSKDVRLWLDSQTLTDDGLQRAKRANKRSGGRNSRWGIVLQQLMEKDPWCPKE